jgi:hypothetical protein
MGFESEAAFWAEHTARLGETRRIVIELLFPGCASAVNIR